MPQYREKGNECTMAVIYEEVPYAYVIRFEGKVTVPVDNEEQALFEVKKALNKAVELFEVWNGNKEYCNPEYDVWHDGFVLANLVEVKDERMG